MKIVLDTDNKTIKLENNAVLSKLIETLDKLLPNGEWKEFTLETNTVINHWSNPIVIERKTVPYYPSYPWYIEPNKITYTALGRNDIKTFNLKAGRYNVEA